MPITARAQDQPPSLYHQKKYIMGTVFEIVVYDASAARANDAMEQALREIVRLDAVMSNYKTDSELSALNRNAHDRPETVSPDLYRVIEESLQYSRLTGGKFDVTVGPLVDRWKAVMNGEPAPSLEEQEKLRACVGYQKIELISPDRIEFHSSCLRIDLGAIGKGYAVDRAAEILRSRGIKNALIDAGGSTWYGMGSPPEQSGWLVRLRDPSESIDPQVILHDNSVSTSEQTPPSELGNDSPGHIIDPAQGAPLKTRYAISAIAKSGTASDGLSTSLLLVGPAEGKKLILQVPDTAAIWISAEGKTEIASSGPKILLKGRWYNDSAAMIRRESSKAEGGKNN
ncbi:MAG TPA: FAD:protein FMN transferase [Candidatus Acidoferrum sp.]|jgi:thiamine biosynthesis lipoprotein